MEIFWETPKNDKINKNIYVKSYFLSVIDISMVKEKTIGKQRYVNINNLLFI